jgi:hypothetical protein
MSVAFRRDQESFAMNDLDLHAEANKIRGEFDAANTAGRTRLQHGIAAGFRLLKVDEYLKRGARHKGGFCDWLRQHGFNKADAYDFMLLAGNAETARNSAHSSIHAILQMLRAKVGNSGKSKKSGASGSPLSKAARTKATVQERQAFLDTIGRFCLHSTKLLAELKRRVGDQQRATTSALGEAVAKVSARRCRGRRLRGQGTCRPRGAASPIVPADNYNARRMRARVLRRGLLESLSARPQSSWPPRTGIENSAKW